jgi:hypothetical protein
MATEYTTHYNLDLYTDTDKPNLRDQYNGAMNKIDSQLNTFSNNLVIVTDAANQAKEQAKAASDSSSANAQSISTLQNTVSDIDTAYKAADSSITDAYKAADTKLSSDITSAYKAADTKLSSDITSAYKAADTKLSSDITAAYKAADSTLAAHFPIKSSDIAAGAITRDKLDAQALESIIKGITIRRFDANDSTADNTGLVAPNNCNLAGYYIPELTMLVITNFIVGYGQAVGNYRDISTAEFKLPDYVPHPTTNIQVNAIGIVYTSDTDFKRWTGIGISRTGCIGVNSPISSSDNTALAMAGNAVVFLRAYGAA